MPFIDAKTTVKATDAQIKELTSLFGEAIALIPGKSEEWLMVNIEGEKKMAFAASFADCAILEVKIFGKASKESYDSLTERLCQAVGRVLGIDEARIYIKYEEVSVWGWNGFNF